MEAKLKLALNNKGYTYLETLIVLAIVSIIFFVSLINVANFNDNRVIKQNITLIGSLFNGLQTKSITQNAKGYIKFRTNKIDIHFDNKLIKTYNLDEKLNITSNFDGDRLEVNKYGNVLRGGTITINYKEKSKKMIFSIGEGRYRVE